MLVEIKIHKKTYSLQLWTHILYVYIQKKNCNRTYIRIKTKYVIFMFSSLLTLKLKCKIVYGILLIFLKFEKRLKGMVFFIVYRIIINFRDRYKLKLEDYCFSYTKFVFYMFMTFDIYISMVLIDIKCVRNWRAEYFIVVNNILVRMFLWS